MDGWDRGGVGGGREEGGKRRRKERKVSRRSYEVIIDSRVMDPKVTFQHTHTHTRKLSKNIKLRNTV